jgi:hypothetical protein
MPVSRIAIVSILGFLAGYSHATAQQADVKGALVEAKACLASVYSSPDAAPLRAHIPLDMNAMTLAQLSDPTYASRTEISALMGIHPRILACRSALIAALGRTAPWGITIAQRLFAGGDDDKVLLVQRKLPWGEYVKRGRDRLLAASAEIQQQLSSTAAAGQQRMQDEAVRRAQQQATQVLEAQQRAIAQQQLLDASRTFFQMGQPSQLPYGAYTLPSAGTNCTYGGGYMHCN